MTAARSTSPVAVEAELSPVVDPQASGEWIAVHVYYSSNNHPLLVDAVAPVVDSLRRDGLLASWFFIRYWMEGPHLRVRLKPRRMGDQQQVVDRLYSALDSFLADRPALYEMDERETSDLFKEMFLGEYDAEQWDELYGESGSMPMRPNNSYVLMRYEPEIGRYGGPSAIDVAERHFEASSDMVRELVETTNVHVRSVHFGLAAQLMTVMLGVFQNDIDESACFLSSYRTYWERSGAGEATPRHEAYARAFDTMQGDLRDHLGAVYQSAARRDPDELNGFLQEWAQHCIDLHDSLSVLAANSELMFPLGADGDMIPVDIATGTQALLSGYLHMTNNRLGVSIIDECYISYLIEHALVDGGARSQEFALQYMFGGTGADR